MTSDLVADADRALSEGRLDEAIRISQSVLAVEPENFPAQLVMGVGLVKQGRFGEALSALASAEAVDTGTGKPALWLSRALRGLAENEGALDAAIRAVQCNPSDPSIRYQFGICLLEMGRDEEALAAFHQLTKMEPASAPGHLGMGLALKSLARNSAAITSFKRATVLAPESVQNRVSYFQALMDESDTRGALECARVLLAMSPGVESLLRLARAQLIHNDVSAAEASVREAEAIGLPDGMSACAAGTILQGLGRIDEAESRFRQAIELSPDLGMAYSGLAFVRKVTEEDRPLVERMEALAARSDLGAPDRSHVHYALGKSYEDLGQYEGAFVHYRKANELAPQARFGLRRFDRTYYAQRVDDSLRVNRSRGKTAGSDSDLPVFVIGMLRSGTTLVEQILSSHPQVGSAGEQGFWLHNRDALVDANAVERLAGKYLATLREMWPAERRVVDKMPDNYLILPSLHAAFPNAKFIHLVRNPVDICLSIYTTINRLDLDWSHDMDDIAFVYRQYLRMTAAWREQIPSEAIMEVRYEELVAEPEKVTREMIDFVGIPWDDACLSPERNPRGVSTPSAWQVRQPVYTTSVERWRRFEPWIAPFAELLGNKPKH